LDLREVLETNYRDLRQTEQLGRLEPPMPRANLLEFIDQYRRIEAKRSNAARNRFDLFVRVSTRIARIGFERRQRQVDQLPSRQSLARAKTQKSHCRLNRLLIRLL
jgi:hypothetical protein